MEKEIRKSVSQKVTNPILEVPYFLVPHNIFKLTIGKLTLGERFFCIYLLAKFNHFGNQEDFYLTDEQIQKDLCISRKTIYLWRKGVKSKGFLDYKSGKYRKSATIYYIKRVILGDESVLNLLNNKEIIKQEINKEDFYLPTKPKNWLEETFKVMGAKYA